LQRVDTYGRVRIEELVHASSLRRRVQSLVEPFRRTNAVLSRCRDAFDDRSR